MKKLSKIVKSYKKIPRFAYECEFEKQLNIAHNTNNEVKKASEHDHYE